MSDFSLVLPITKVDAVQRLVYARAAQETPDRSGEILDYASAKPAFEKWSADIHQASGGKSYGNIRAMHGKTAAGILSQPLSFDDDAKAVDAVVKVVDDAEWKKVEAGVYTGLSIGGSYAKRWTDPQDSKLIRYTPEPSEISLVDNPCIPTATFKLVKADGMEEDRPFKQPDTNWHPELTQGWAATDGKFFAKKADALAHNEALAKLAGDPAAQALAALAKLTQTVEELEKGGDEPGDGKKPYGDVDYADSGMQSDKKKRYPLDTAKHIRAAWSYINKPKNGKKYAVDDLAKVKAKIIAAWKDKIDKDGPPSAEKAEFYGDLQKVATLFASYRRDNAAVLRKGMYHVGCLARLLQEFADLEDAVEWEQAVEGDTTSDLPAKMGMLIGSIGQLLREMVDEEVSEMAEAENPDSEKGERIIAAHQAEEPDKTVIMQMAVTAKELAKGGKRNSAADQDRIQAMHDHSQALGGKCDHANCDCPMDGKAAGGDLEKLAAERDAALETLTKVTPAIDDLQKKVEQLLRQPSVPHMVARLGLHGVPKAIDGLFASEPPVDERGFREKLADLTDPAERARFLLAHQRRFSN